MQFLTQEIIYLIYIQKDWMYFKQILLCNKTWIALKHQGARVANKTNSLPTRSLHYLDSKPILFIFYDKSTYTNCQVSPSTTRVPNFRFPSSNSLSFFFRIYQHLSLIASLLFLFMQLFYSIFLILSSSIQPNIH